MRKIELKYVTIEQDGEWVITRFKSDGSVSRSRNTGDPWQMEICGWVGCAGDIHEYQFEHEFLHSFLSEKMHDGESYVVGMDARDKKMSTVGGLFEERWCYHFHKFLNGVGEAVEPEWFAWRDEALQHLGRKSNE